MMKRLELSEVDNISKVTLGPEAWLECQLPYHIIFGSALSVLFGNGKDEKTFPYHNSKELIRLESYYCSSQGHRLTLYNFTREGHALLMALESVLSMGDGPSPPLLQESP